MGELNDEDIQAVQIIRKRTYVFYMHNFMAT